MVHRLCGKNERSSTDFNFGMPTEEKNSTGIDMQLRLPRLIASRTVINTEIGNVG